MQALSQYDTNPLNAGGQRTVRVLVLGGSSSEGMILASLSELVSQLDRRFCASLRCHAARCMH